MKFWEFFRRMLSEDNGTPSTTRWGAYNSIYMIWALVVTIIFIALKQYPDLYIYALATVITIIASIFWGTKVWQKGKEEKTETPEVKP